MLPVTIVVSYLMGMPDVDQFCPTPACLIAQGILMVVVFEGVLSEPAESTLFT